MSLSPEVMNISVFDVWKMDIIINECKSDENVGSNLLESMTPQKIAPSGYPDPSRPQTVFAWLLDSAQLVDLNLSIFNRAVLQFLPR